MAGGYVRVVEEKNLCQKKAEKVVFFLGGGGSYGRKNSMYSSATHENLYVSHFEPPL